MKYLAFWIAVMALIGGAVAIASGTGDEGRNIQACATKYRDAGLVVVGVHSPEFGFEKDAANVKNAVAELGIDFVVPIDSDHAIWSAFRNEYWPADYIIDGKGRIRYHHFGEGEYEKSERVIRELLVENGATGLSGELVRVAGHWGGGAAERTTLQASPGKVVFRFHSRDVHMVLGPAKSGGPIRFRVTLNGAAPGEHHGVDCDADGSGEVREPRMYQLIRQKGRVDDSTFEIEFVDPGVEVYSFTFG